MVAAVGTPTRRRDWLDRRLAGLKANRTRHESMWVELEEQFPSGARINVDADPASGKAGTRQEAVYDATGQLAVNRCVAGIMSNTTSPARQWHRNTLDDQEALEESDVQRYLDEVTAIQRRALQKSNTYRVLPHIYRELVVFGTGAALALPDFDNVIHLHPMVTGSYWLGQDSKGKVNACYREIWMTIAQIVERWPDTCSQQIKDAYARGEWDGWRKVVHAIEPRSRRSMSSPLALDMPWASYYYEPGSRQDESDLLEEGGYRHFPVLAPRWKREGEDIYGYSPASEALPFVRQLQLQTLSEGKAIAREAEPPVQVPTVLKNDDVDTSPNGITYYDQTTPSGGVRRLIEQPSDPSWLRASMADVRVQIQQMLFLDLFQMLAMAGVDTKMTATEVAQRVEEKMLMLGPVMQNLHDELLVPLLELIYYYLQEGGALPPPPELLQGRDFTPEFLSVLYQAQKAVSVNAVERWLMLVGGMAQAKADPSIWDGVDTDWILRDSASNLGVPAKAVMSKDQVQALRDARAAAQAQQAELAMAQQQAATAKDLGQTPMGTGSALDALTGYSTV
jgi:hypothetical protein